MNPRDTSSPARRPACRGGVRRIALAALALGGLAAGGNCAAPPDSEPDAAKDFPAAVIIAPIPPPPLRDELAGERPERPSPGHIWVGGYWAWRTRRYEWVHGHWEMPPDWSAWEPPRWENEGGGYRFHEGYWKG